MNNPYHQQIRYQKINIYPNGLLSLHFNQLHPHNLTSKKNDTPIDNPAQPQQNQQQCKIDTDKGLAATIENPQGISNISSSKANVHDSSAFLYKSSVTQNAENVPSKTVKLSSNISSDSIMRNRSSWKRRSKEPRNNYRDNKQENSNINDQGLWKKMPALPPFTGPSQNKSIQTKSRQSLFTKTRISFNTTNNINYQNPKTVDWKNNKTFQSDNNTILLESRITQQCRVNEQKPDEQQEKWNHSESPTKQNWLQNSRSTRNESTTHNSLMFDSSIMSIDVDFEENKHANFSKKQSKAEVSSKKETQSQKQLQNDQQRATISQLQALLDEQRAKNKQKSEEVLEIKKQLKQLSAKYESQLKSQQIELNKRLQKCLHELKCEQDKNIETMIENINQNSSRQLNNIVTRFQQSIRVIQEEYNNYKHTAQEQKHTLNTNVLTAQRIIQDLKTEIDRLSKKSEVMDRQLQTDMSEVLIEKLDTEQEKQSALLKLNKQSRLIQKLQKKIKEYKSEYERIFYKSQDYRNYIKESELIISDLTRDIHNLQRETRNYHKNQASLNNVIEQLSGNMLIMHLHELNKKYEFALEQSQASVHGNDTNSYF